MQKAQKLLNHYLNQAAHYKIKEIEQPYPRLFFNMYQDKILGATAMIEHLDCDPELKQYAQNVRQKLDDFNRMTKSQLIDFLKVQND